jgi:hypothetical protein
MRQELVRRSTVSIHFPTLENFKIRDIQGQPLQLDLILRPGFDLDLVRLFCGIRIQLSFGNFILVSHELINENLESANSRACDERTVDCAGATAGADRYHPLEINTDGSKF